MKKQKRKTRTPLSPLSPHGGIIGLEGRQMLNEFRIKRVWECMLAAEARSLYFGDLAVRYTRKRQWITGLSFFSSSGAAATIIAKSPPWVPLVLAVLSAGATAYAMAVNLDRRIATMAKLHSAWAQIATEYDHLWNHAGDMEAEDQLEKIMESEKEPSELATMEAPNNQRLLGKWQGRVFSLYHLADQE
ncbi:MAG TPA: hypothetical protein VEU11_05940 [Terriglobales bacterium]|nr:hypothetical protein [Terriglobales bacterium]